MAGRVESCNYLIIYVTFGSPYLIRTYYLGRSISYAMLLHPMKEARR